MSGKRKKKKKQTRRKKVLLFLALGLFSGIFIFFADKVITNIKYPIEYYNYIEKYSSRYDVPIENVCAVIDVESSFNRDSLSSKGAVGLMQITPDTCDWLCGKMGETPPDSLYNPEDNIKYGTYFLKILHDEFLNWETAYAAYNAGRSKVNSWLKDERYSDGEKLTNIPYTETKEYVQKVSTAAKAYKKLYFED